MRQRVRENALCACMAAAGCAGIAWLGLYGFGWNDYEVEVEPAYQALLAGHVASFLRLAPAFGGSLIERAPFALLPGLWGGGQLAVYRLGALPCLLAAAALGVWLVARMRAQGRSRFARAVALAVCVANPITLVALEFGHPEELLGGCMCVAAVLLAARSSSVGQGSLAAGALLGLAVANKEWALVAAGPVLLAVPPGRARARAAAGACAACALVLAPLLLVRSGSFTSNTAAAAVPSGSIIFKPWQIWWFLGQHRALLPGPSGALAHGYRAGPAWTSVVSHPLILLVAAAIAVALWSRTRGRALGEPQALLALALLLLLRCLLDTWDEAYYPLPFLLGLLAWDATRDTPHPPLLALAGSALVWFSFTWLELHATPDVQATVFLAWSLPFAAWLGMRLRADTAPARAHASGDDRELARQPGQDLAAAVTHHHELLDAHPQLPREIHARLDRHHVARQQLLLRGRPR
jgi:hypothetical protein